MSKSTMRALAAKYAYLAWFGGSLYVTLEVFWRSRSHWTMFLLAAFLFLMIGGLNEIWTSWRLIPQAVAGALIATAAELITGCIVNIWLGWGIWDYSDMPGNLLGQICPQFALLWVALSALAIVLDDIIRWRFFGEDKPHYRL